MATAILNGDAVTGVTIMELAEEMDSGPIVAQSETSIGPTETTEELTPRLFRMGAELLTEVLPSWARGEIVALPQDHSKVTFTTRLSKEDGDIDWTGAISKGFQYR